MSLRKLCLEEARKLLAGAIFLKERWLLSLRGARKVKEPFRPAGRPSVRVGWMAALVWLEGVGAGGSE